MRKLAIVLVLAILLGGGAVTALSAPSYAQGYYEYTTPPPDPYAQPWVGPGTPWVYYQGDWFLNGILYLFFGPDYGWGPYYAYPYSYVVRPARFYAPFYLTWYSTHPVIVERFIQTYPYWRPHRHGHHYDQRFYEQHHRGQGGGWHQGFKGRPAPAVQPQAPRPAPSQVAPPERRQAPPTRVAPPEGVKPAPVAPPERREPGRVAPPERPRPGPAPMAPPEGRRPVAPPEGPKAAPAPGPAHVAPPAAPRPGPAAPAPKPAPATKPAPAPAPAAPGAPAEKGGHGEEKH